ncbi:polysaccharide biosynthesis/export family protein [Phenylobacterium sp.]|jgi:polysaccharide export outer membrane protein|uniref:polysaccharide biosynthesis/export family protein n=1 Tax=Phenylobacterium sp. TaxID=1871053 RepID=UPI002E358C22|nr:polysaccharide biosynthesis/export family protein [Phenylobacterium sp.]HEX4709847.1 polysaccharide biosynthesis/export family protein [Phenylobacterium sp.]
MNLALALLVQAGPWSAAAAAEPLGRSPPQAEAPMIPAPTATVDARYRIGPDDSLEVIVFQVPELSRVVQVDATGEFSLPLVGRIKAAGHTADEVEALLKEKLAGRFLKDPVITVLVKQAVSQRVTVDGAVVKPGVYNLTGPTSLMQALALANGPDARVANVRKVAIFRSVAGERKGEVFDLAKIRDGKATDPQVRADDIIVVESSGVRSFFSYFGSSLTLLTLLTRF